MPFFKEIKNLICYALFQGYKEKTILIQTSDLLNAPFQRNTILIQRNQQNIYRPSGNTKNGGKYISFNSKGDSRIGLIKHARFGSNRCLQNYSICNRSIVHTPGWQQHLWYCDNIVYEHIWWANCNIPSRPLIICENTFPSKSVIFLPTFLQFL